MFIICRPNYACSERNGSNNRCYKGSCSKESENRGKISEGIVAVMKEVTSENGTNIIEKLSILEGKGKRNDESDEVPAEVEKL